MRLLGLVFRLAVAATAGIIEVVLWGGFGLRRAAGVLGDVYRARVHLRGGELRCPRNHVVPTEGVFTCGACTFTYTGSAWACANPDCGLTTSFTDCPECGLSVRSPYRYGSS